MLSVARLVNVTVNLSPLAAAGRSFGVLMVAGDSPVIGGLERLRSYSDIDGVASDFGVNAPEYLAADLYFGQSPKPANIMIGRWLRTATGGQNIGGLLTSAQQSVSAWTPISAGSLSINIDGAAQVLSGLNFTGVTNLNGVASVIQAALTGGATCVWNGQYFKISSGSSGAGAQASGTITMSANPTAGNTLVINGTTITFVAATPTGNQVLIGANAIATAANLQLFLQGSSDANLVLMTYSTSGAVTTVTAVVSGVAGNAYTLSRVGANIVLSGATLAGGAVPSSVGYATASGSGTDISSMLGLTSALSQGLAPGYAAESPVQCAQVLASKSSAWYGLMFGSSVQPSTPQHLAVAGYIEATTPTRVYGLTIQDTSVMSALVTNDVASQLQALGYDQTIYQYSSSSPYAIASAIGRAFSVDFTANTSTITLMFKQEPGVAGEDLTSQQADTLKAKNCNVFADYDDDTVIFQYGTMASGAFFDEIHGLDWFQDAVQTACYNVLYQSTTKVPQTDAGVNQLVNAIHGVCDEAVNNGLCAPGTWNADGFGAISNGQYLKAGYYIYAAPIANQSQSDREARKSPPIQVALKLAGAIQSLNVLVNVNR